MKIEIYNKEIHEDKLKQFFSEIDVVNNKSIETLALNKRKDFILFLTIIDDKIVSMCYAHDFSDYYPLSWRIFTRTATLPKYRAKGFPKQRSMVSAAGLTAYTVPLQVDYAMSKGAKNILFTTNTDGGLKSSQKLDKYLKKIEAIQHLDLIFGMKKKYTA